jgi:hypothetical protein
MWEAQAESAVSFGLESVQAPTWRVQLPAEPEAAQAVLAGYRQAQERGRQDLARAQRELAQLGQAEEVSFGEIDELGACKSALQSAVDELSRPVSYGLDLDKQELYGQWNAFVEQVRQLVTNYAYVETALANALVGTTRVGWKGDFQTTWEASLEPEAMQTHLQAVQLALAWRLALMRTVSVIATGAAGLAVKAAVPGGQVLLLPAAWRFVRDVLKELRQLRAQVNT